MSNKKKGPKKAKNRIRKNLLAFLKEHPGKPFNLKQLRTKLGVNSSTDSMHLENAAGQLVHEGVLELEGHARIKFKGTPQTKRKLLGVLDMARTGAGFVKTDQFDQDVFIPAKHVKDALPGDTVEVNITSTKGKRPEGTIVGVEKRGRELYICILQLHEKFAFAVPTHKKMPIDFFVPPTRLGGAKDGDLVAVKLLEYDVKQNNPVGSVSAVLGKPGEHQSEMNAIILGHNLPTEFHRSLLEAADKIDGNIAPAEIEKRRDFREVLTMTIDPWDAKDFDDAVSLQKLDDDLYEIGVHIADVSHYVQPDSKIDKEAQERATSVYLVDRVIPMLPERLSNDLCSLRPNEDKLCFSAVFQIDTAGKVKDRWIGRTVIHSDRRFTYEEAQERIETGEGDLAEEVKILDGIAKKLREQRFAQGSVAFDREEMRFKLDEKGHPIDIVIKVSKDAHKLIEEFMLLANREVSENYRRYVKSKTPPPFVYRVHDEPDQKKLLGLQEMAARFGYSVNLVENEKASSEINKLLKASKGKPEYGMLSILAIRSMSKAKYTTKNNGHYGLAFKHYTHFTSPIRRYPDVMVHRLLAQYLDGNAKADDEWLEAQCQHSSLKEVSAEEAERDSTKYKMVEYMQQFIGEEFDGSVSGVTEHTLFVELSNRCEGGVRLSEMIDDTYYFDEGNYRIVGHNKRRTFNLGQEVRVRVISCNLEKRSIELDMLDGATSKKVKPARKTTTKTPDKAVKTKTKSPVKPPEEEAQTITEATPEKPVVKKVAKKPRTKAEPKKEVAPPEPEQPVVKETSDKSPDATSEGSTWKAPEKVTFRRRRRPSDQ